MAASVQPAGEDVDHGERDLGLPVPCEGTPQWQTLGCGNRPRSGTGHTENRVGAEPRLVRCPVQIDQEPVHLRLVGRVAAQRVRNRGRDVCHSIRHGPSRVGPACTVAQFASLVDTSGRTGRHLRGRYGAICESDFDFKGRSPSRI